MFERIVIFIWSNKEEAHATRLKDIDISTSTIDLAIVKPLTNNVILTTKVKWIVLGIKNFNISYNLVDYECMRIPISSIPYIIMHR